MKATTILVIFLVSLALAAPVAKRQHKSFGDPMLDFIEGFLEGLNENGDVKKVLECLHDIEPISLEIIKALELIMKLNMKDVIEGVHLLMKAVWELLSDAKPCSEGLEQLKKFMEAVTHVNIMKVIQKIMNNPGGYLNDIMECITAFKEGDYYDFGQGLGDILFRLLLAQVVPEKAETLPKMDFNEFVKMVQGFLDGAGHDKKFVDIEKCLIEFPEIVTDIIEAIEFMKKINWKDLTKLVEALLKLVDIFTQLLDIIKPCSKVPQDVDELIRKLREVKITKLLERMVLNAVELLADINLFMKEYEAKEYYESGKDLGDVFYLLIFKD